MERQSTTRAVSTGQEVARAVASGAIRVVATTMIGIGSVVGGAAFLVSPAPAAAQDASPAAGEVIDATECLVEPLSDEYLSGLAATPSGDEATSDATPEQFTPPEGEPAGDAEVEAATATVRELVACLNAADFRRVYALYTEDYLVQTFAGEPVDAAQATPEPTEEATQNALIGVGDVIVLEDGRLGAQVDTAGADGLQVSMYMIFENTGDRWLIDEVTILEAASQEDGAGDGGTPTS